MELKPGTYRLEGYIDVPLERLEAIETALQEHIRLTREEPGCIYFNVDPCPDNQGRFIVSEAFVDEAAFAFHQERGGNSPWAKISEGIPRNFKKWVVEER